MSQTLEIDTSTESLTTSVVRSLEEFVAFEDQWRQLVNKSEKASVFEQFEWMLGWWKSFGGSSRLMIIAVRDDCGQLVGIAPLYTTRSVVTMGLRRIGLIGDRYVGSDYLGIIARSGYGCLVGQEVARELLLRRKDWDYFDLRDVATSTANLELFHHLSNAGLIEDVRKGYPCRFISLPREFDAYLQTVGANLRGNFRRRLRNLEKQHTVEFHCVRSGTEFEQAYRQLIALHTDRFESRQAKSAFTGNTDIETFHFDVAQVLANRGLARLFQLKIDGQVVAALYGFQVADSFQFFQCGMMSSWLSAGIGQVTIGLSIKGAIELGCTEFDFLRGDESYKTKWAIDVRHTQYVRFYGRRAGPMLFRSLALFQERVRSQLKTLIKNKTVRQPEQET